ncbi:NAD-dependent epimerase/dehydratase family protein [Acetobacter fallax]|uniref:NAD-dependent epimerase/dehydratase family protein n=1 Tax=Acetobacter fallax TaxID=1737473 RepID=A0ABX0K9Y2_9PROT|nr:NAD(P)-dependent oxidoreductase [Acetobacter fallax]NHO33199.1 NAD-dependent epimerase/dehydratase family protein [Acetobacter fallax]NHO36773.1 NAD-dependent epimerase/dehydratase family protein [Acetobacter fallax]
MKVFVAGASGVLGRALIVRLLQAGHQVWGMAHRSESLAVIRALGAEPVQGNALDREGVHAVMARIRPDSVIDQLTSLPASPFDLPQRLPADRRLRLEGGGNLFDAAQVCGVQRYVQQSCGFYLEAPGGLADEASRLRTEAPGQIGESARMYAALEKRVLQASGMLGTALRYGFFYGPGTWYWHDGAFSAHVRASNVSIIGAGSATFSFIHVEDAAAVTVAALSAPGGIYNVVDDQPAKVSQWLPAYAKWIGAAAPSRVDEREALHRLGEESVYYQNSLNGAINRKAKRDLGLAPRRLAWLTV